MTSVLIATTLGLLAIGLALRAGWHGRRAEEHAGMAVRLMKESRRGRLGPQPGDALFMRINGRIFYRIVTLANQHDTIVITGTGLGSGWTEIEGADGLWEDR